MCKLEVGKKKHAYPKNERKVGAAEDLIRHCETKAALADILSALAKLRKNIKPRFKEGYDAIKDDERYQEYVKATSFATERICDDLDKTLTKKYLINVKA